MRSYPRDSSLNNRIEVCSDLEPHSSLAVPMARNADFLHCYDPQKRLEIARSRRHKDNQAEVCSRSNGVEGSLALWV